MPSLFACNNFRFSREYILIKLHGRAHLKQPTIVILFCLFVVVVVVVVVAVVVVVVPLK